MSESGLTIESEGSYAYADAGILDMAVEERPCELSYGMQDRRLEDRISRVDRGGDYTYATIDKVVKIKTFSPRIFKERVCFWEKRRVSSGKHLLASALVATTLLVGGIVFSFPALIGGGVLGSLFSGYHLIQIISASAEIHAWKQDPAKVIADRRKEAFHQGLPFIYQKDASHTSCFKKYQNILNRRELQYLYDQYFCHLSRRFLLAYDDDTKLDLMNAAVSYSPLDPKIYLYACIPASCIAQMNTSNLLYVNFLNAYHSLNSSMQEAECTVKKHFQKRMETIEQQKGERLRSREEGSGPDRQNFIEEELKRLDTELQKIKEAQEAALAHLQKDRKLRCLLLFPYASLLHQGAYRSFKGERVNFIYLNEGLEMGQQVAPYQYIDQYDIRPTPSAPLEELFQHPNDPPPSYESTMQSGSQAQRPIPSAPPEEFVQSQESSPPYPNDPPPPYEPPPSYESVIGKGNRE